MSTHAPTKITAVVTALNEQETIGPLTTALLSYCANVIVINDGSTDNTGINAAMAGARVINHAEPHGIAASLMEAWRIAVEGGADWVVQIDAGGSHSVRNLPRMLLAQDDIVIGSRFCLGAQYIGGRRAWFSRTYARFCNWLMGGEVTSDWTSGYRLFSKYAINALLNGADYWTNGHAWQAEVIHRAARYGLTIIERPITYTAGRSSMQLSAIDDAFLVLLKVMFL